jgi:hypothetical protein
LGQAKQRGTFEQRKAEAIASGRDKSANRSVKQRLQAAAASIEKEFLAQASHKGLLALRNNRITVEQEAALDKLAQEIIQAQILQSKG